MKWIILVVLLVALLVYIAREARRMRAGAGILDQAVNTAVSNPNGLSVRLVLGLAIVGVFYALCVNTSVGLLVVAGAAFLTARGFTEIKSPNVGFLFIRGVLIGSVEPGWYLTIVGVSSIECKSKAVIKAEVGHETMYTKELTEISVEPSGYFQIMDLKRAIFISDEDILAKVKMLMRSKAKTAVGMRSFTNLISGQNTLEQEVEQAINDEIAENGYRMTTLELCDFDDDVESEARRVRHVGEAEAYVAGETAKKIKEGVGDSWQGVLAIAAGEIGKGIRERVSGPRSKVVSKKKKGTEENEQ